MGQFQPAISVAQVISKIDSNLLLLPAIQREFIWKHWQIELLFDSLMRGYPIGSLLFWRVLDENKTSHRYYSILKKYYINPDNASEKYHFDDILQRKNEQSLRRNTIQFIELACGSFFKKLYFL